MTNNLYIKDKKIHGHALVLAKDCSSQFRRRHSTVLLLCLLRNLLEQSLHVTSSRSIVVDHVLPIVPLLLFNTVPFEDNSLIFVIFPDPGKSSRVNFTSLPKVWSMIKSSVGLSFILLYDCCKICNYKSVKEEVS